MEEIRMEDVRAAARRLLEIADGIDDDGRPRRAEGRPSGPVEEPPIEDHRLWRRGSPPEWDPDAARLQAAGGRVDPGGAAVPLLYLALATGEDVVAYLDANPHLWPCVRDAARRAE